MKNLLMTVAAAGCFCLSTSAPFAQEGKEEKTDAKAETRTERKAEDKDRKNPKPRMLHGTGSVLKVAGTDIQVQLRNKGALTLAVDPATIVLRGRNAARLEEVKAGQRVRVIYESREGGNAATEIHLLPAKVGTMGHEKAKEKEKEKEEKKEKAHKP